ncbi:AGC family protein kinase [Tritrichomonas foetus]|uniref:AGC family protein kinase n=1 Tax=Tritrichomonas foetus TaxID=1144522 RepID=A0A1J4KUY5_9EUKA|nr:AGC family protein kinase [Tritrichomonas foetus]|eukprot:OHT15113.1 AGC family protein kinase [Tritrichomonas foetus]
MNKKDNKAQTSGTLQRKVFLVWTKRFAVFDNTKFTLYKDKGQKKIDIELTITPESKIEVLDKEKAPRFKISSNGEVLLLEAETNNDMMRWIISLRSCSYVAKRLSMDNFNIISYIGEGYYGKVALVERKDTKEKYAIKIIRKRNMIQNNRIHTVITERNILQLANHPFIVPLKFAFQSSNKFYLGLEYEPGGELRTLIEEQPTIPLSDIKIYIAEISLAIEYLHDLGIIYRDLKPENILFDEDGHIKLTDFGLAKDMYHSRSSLSFCGTPEYIAPEIISHTPYDESIDWWSLGILMYELVFKRTPFANDNNKAKIYHNIVETQPEFPSYAPIEITDLILRLLKKDPKERGSIIDIKMSKLFKDVNFNDVFQKKIKPSYKPLNNSLKRRPYRVSFDSASNSTSSSQDSPTHINNFSFDEIYDTGIDAQAFDKFSV